MEQCFFCLFTYPNRPKTRNIQDHGVKQILLTWKDGLLLFNHFRPHHLPEFDSFKTSTVSLELSQFLLKLLPLVPSSILNQIPNTEDDLSSFIKEESDAPSALKPLPDNADLQALSDMYYLLADYYFKNNEMAKGVKYYLLDLRVNSQRFDPWDGLALARSSQTEDRLRLCENKKISTQSQREWNGEKRHGWFSLL